MLRSNSYLTPRKDSSTQLPATSHTSYEQMGIAHTCASPSHLLRSILVFVIISGLFLSLFFFLYAI